MIKKTLITSVFAVLILAFSVPASATTSSVYLDDKVYKISGKMTVKVNLTNYISLSATIPNLANYGEMFLFLGNGTWMDYLLYSAGDSGYTSGIDYPTWSQSGSNFTINLSGMADSIESALGSYVNLSSGATKNPVITGKISKDGKSISGKMNLGWNMSTYVEGYGNISGSITISMTYKGTYYTYIVYNSLTASESKTALQNVVRDAIVSALSSLPKKSQEPAE